MAQTIKIKRSNSAENPTNLKEGELAYIHSSDTAGKLYIGRPGTGDAGTGIASSIDIIGGLLDHDKLSGIEANADVTDTTNVTAAGALMDSEVANLAQVKAFDSSDYLTAHQDISGKADLSGAAFTGNVATAGTLATGGYTLASTDGTSGQALVTDGSGNVSFGDVTVDISGKADLSGADFTGDVGIADDVSLNFGASDDLTIYHDDTTGSSFIKETGTGVLALQGDSLLLSDINASKYLLGISGGETRIYYNGDQKLHTQDAGVGVTGDLSATGTLATGGFTLSSTDGTNGQALVTDGSGNVAFGDVTVDVSGKADLSGATFTGDVSVNGNADLDGTITLGSAAVVGTGSSESPEFPAKDTTVKADLIVDGNLTVSGTTTTINTETIELADNLIELNSNATGNSSIGTSGLNAGIIVNRGSGTTVEGGNIYSSELRWLETAGEWTVSEAFYTPYALLHVGNFEDKITELDGGTFS